MTGDIWIYIMISKNDSNVNAKRLNSARSVSSFQASTTFFAFYQLPLESLFSSTVYRQKRFQPRIHLIPKWSPFKYSFFF